jgi:hypothetical protein
MVNQQFAKLQSSRQEIALAIRKAFTFDDAFEEDGRLFVMIPVNSGSLGEMTLKDGRYEFTVPVCSSLPLESLDVLYLFSRGMLAFRAGHRSEDPSVADFYIESPERAVLRLPESYHPRDEVYQLCLRWEIRPTLDGQGFGVFCGSCSIVAKPDAKTNSILLKVESPSGVDGDCIALQPCPTDAFYSPLLTSTDVLRGKIVSALADIWLEHEKVVW